MIKGLIWNIWGSASMRRLKLLIRLHQLSFVAIMEPMVSLDCEEEFQQRLGFSGCLVSPSNKIWLFFSDHYTMVTIKASPQLLHIEFQHVWSRSTVCATFVYENCSRAERLSLWDDL